MTERNTPYIGISGIVDRGQQHVFTEQFHDHGLNEYRRLALGVKAVHKTQFLDIENKYGPEWYPVGAEDFSGAVELSDSFAVAQVCFDSERVADPDYRSAFTSRISSRGKGWLDALQFDMLPWHTDDTIPDFFAQTKLETGHGLILQAHGESMEMLGPQGVVRKLGASAASLDYILFDASHGKGVRMDPVRLLPYLDAAYESAVLAHVGIGVAGGLNAQVVTEDLPALLDRYPDLSWDAEGQLHPVNMNGRRPLDETVVDAYLRASAGILKA